MRIRLLYLLSLMTLNISISAQNPAPIGLEFLINTTQTERQSKPSIDVNPNGDFVVVWQHHISDNPFFLRAQRFDNTYTPIGAEFQVNLAQAGYVTSPKVEMLDDGGFVILWQSQWAGTKFRVYDAAGNPATGELTTPSEGTGAGVSSDGTSVFIISYRQDFPAEIKAQRYNLDGSTLGGLINISEGGDLSYSISDVSMSPDQSFIVAFSASKSSNPPFPQGFTKTYNSNAVPITIQSECLTDNYRLFNPLRIERNTSGEYILASRGRAGAGSKLVTTRIYDESGSAMIDQINAVGPTGLVSINEVNGDINSGGNIALTWDYANDVNASSPHDIKSRLYTNSGVAMGPEFTVTTTTAEDQEFPEVVFMPDGTLFYVWSGNGFVGDAEGIYARRFNAPMFPCTAAETPSLSPSSSICAGESTTLSILGGALNDAVDWKWYSENCDGTAAGTGTSISVTPTITTTYYARGEGGCDAGSCASVTVTVKALPAVNTSSNTTTCSGSPTILSASGANSYTWNNNAGSGASVTVAPTSTTTYMVTGTDINGCSSSSPVTVNVNALPTVNISGNTSICVGASTTLTATGASSFVWNNGTGSSASVTVTPTSTTTYMVTGTDGNGCSNTSQVDINVNIPSAINISGNTSICSGTSTLLTASGANDYVWDNGAGNGSNVTVFPSSTTTYSVTGTDSNGCTNDNQVTVIVNSLPSIDIGGNTTICAGAATVLTASGTDNFIWDNSMGTNASITVTPSTTTTYSVTGTDNNGCIGTDQITVMVNQLPDVSISGNSIICAGASTTLIANGASSFDWNNGAWSNPAITVSPSNTTTYSLTGMDNNGCSNTDQITVTVNALPTINISGNTSPCAGSSTILTAGGANNYVWENGLGNTASVTVHPISTTTYSVTGFDNNGCSSTSQVTVNINQTPNVNASGSTTICAGASTPLTASGANSYTWDNGVGNGSNVTVSPLITTTYTVTGTDVNGCTNTSQVTIMVNPLPGVNISGNTSICAGASTTLAASGANSYTWDNGVGNGSNVTVSPLSTTTYTVTGTDVNGCTNTSQVTIIVNPLPGVNISGNTSICAGTSTMLTASGASNYVWDNGVGSNASLIVSPTTTTTYSVTGTDNNGCMNSSQAIVTVNPLPDVSVDYIDNILIAQNNNNGVTYQWLDCNNYFAEISGENGQAYTINQDGEYAVVVSENGCSDTSACVTGIMVGVKESIIAQQVSIYPNPSQGKVNIDLGSLTNATIRIMNVNGQMIDEPQEANVPIHSLEFNEAVGIYFVEIRAQKEVRYFKVIVE